MVFPPPIGHNETHAVAKDHKTSKSAVISMQQRSAATGPTSNDFEAPSVALGHAQSAIDDVPAPSSQRGALYLMIGRHPICWIGRHLGETQAFQRPSTRRIRLEPDRQNRVASLGICRFQPGSHSRLTTMAWTRSGFASSGSRACGHPEHDALPLRRRSTEMQWTRIARAAD
jgi:hypothetical protein